jgi:hypothetical protein
MNRHSPRDGGLSLPDLYDDQGLRQLLHLVGHLKLGDENGKLILCTLSHAQLRFGSKDPLFSLQFSLYGPLLENYWIMSIWSYADITGTTINIEHQWLPELAREGDDSLMDTAV